MNTDTINNQKEEIIGLLRAIDRKGMDAVISYLDKAGFFTAPASVNRHLNEEGGLAQHSLNVYHTAMRLREQMIAMKPEVEKKLPEHSVVIAALLHDVCKTNIYKKTKKWRKNEEDRWEQYDTYEVDYGRFPVGHGEKSAMMALWAGLEITQTELLAIRWHMTAWDLPMQSVEATKSLNAARDLHPLCSLVQLADGIAANLFEHD